MGVLARSLLYMQPREGRRDELIALFERLACPSARSSRTDA